MERIRKRRREELEEVFGDVVTPHCDVEEAVQNAVEAKLGRLRSGYTAGSPVRVHTVLAERTDSKKIWLAFRDAKNNKIAPHTILAKVTSGPNTLWDDSNDTALPICLPFVKRMELHLKYSVPHFRVQLRSHLLGEALWKWHGVSGVVGRGCSSDASSVQEIVSGLLGYAEERGLLSADPGGETFIRLDASLREEFLLPESVVSMSAARVVMAVTGLDATLSDGKLLLPEAFVLNMGENVGTHVVYDLPLKHIPMLSPVEADQQLNPQERAFWLAERSHNASLALQEQHLHECVVRGKAAKMRQQRYLEWGVSPQRAIHSVLVEWLTELVSLQNSKTVKDCAKKVYSGTPPHTPHHPR